MQYWKGRQSHSDCGRDCYFGCRLGLIGLVLLVTGFMSFCPLYSLLGVKTTCEKK